MSGCVNCVWDLYRDEIEEWAAKSQMARERMLAQGQGQRADLGQRLGKESAEGGGVPSHVLTSMDDDGGGSETNWKGEFEVGGKNGKEKGLFDDIPVGIREFMRTEKMLKTKHAQETSVDG